MWLKALFLFQHTYAYVFHIRIQHTYVEKMKILDYFMIAHGKECD